MQLHWRFSAISSAKSVDGQRAYELARKLYREHRDNTDAAAQLSRQRITIHSLRLEAFEPGISGSASAVATSTSAVSAGASNRIHVTDNSALGLPVATIRIACTKGTYIRAFARDLGEALGSGAHLESLCRTRTGDYTLDKALSLEQALALFDVAPNSLKTNILP